MFGYNNPNPYQTYQQPAQFPQRPMFQQPMMQDGSIQARFVSGRVEAEAAAVMPGSMVMLYDRANGVVYTKLIDPQTGYPEFRVYNELRAPQPEPEQPKWATQDDLAAIKAEIEKLKGAIGNV